MTTGLLADADEVLTRAAPQPKPRLTFFEGMKLRQTANGRIGVIVGFAVFGIYVCIDWGGPTDEVVDMAVLVERIRQRDVTIEPTVGIRIESSLGWSGRVDEVCPSRIGITSTSGELVLYERDIFDTLVRLGEWGVIWPIKADDSILGPAVATDRPEHVASLRSRVADLEAQVEAWRNATGMQTPELAEAAMVGAEVRVAAAEARAAVAEARLSEVKTCRVNADFAVR